jgi:PAS domain S-box-containing protein
MESAPNGMIIVDSEGRIVLANATIERMFGYSRAELIGGPVEKLVPEASRRQHEHLRASFRSRPDARTMTLAIRSLHGAHQNGSVFPVEITLNPLRMARGDFVLATVLDMREREQIERAAERERFFQLSGDALCICNASGYFVQVNPAFERILGYSREELLAVPYATFVHPDDVEPTERETQQARVGENVIDFTNRYRAKDGAYRWLRWRAMPDHTGLLYATARDITRDLEVASALQASFQERGVLLQEVHHRVKNNLQIIASMINMQIRRLQPGMAHDALEECGARVQAIALIHATLYQAKDCSRIQFREYATTLIDSIFGALARNPRAIRREVDIAPMSLTVDKAIPCGLIIHELTTNALKHAFPGDRRGTVRVSLREQSAGQLALTVGDDGVGLEPGFEIRSSGSLGLTLVEALVEQLKGRLTIVRAPGTTFEIVFPSQVNP